MTDVEPARALDMLDDLGRATEAAARSRRLRRQLRTQLNSVVDYLSNSRDAQIIALLNKYPFEPTRRNIALVAQTTQALAERIRSTE